MSIPRTLRNMPRVNYAVMHSGSADFSPEKRQLELDQTTPSSVLASSDDKAELDALETERAALASVLEQQQQLEQEQAIQEKKREVEKLRQAVAQLHLKHSSSTEKAKVPTQDRKDSKKKSAFTTKPLVSLDDLRQIDSVSQDVEEKLKRIGLGDVPNESHSSSEEDGSSSDDAHGRASKSRGKPRKKLKSGKTAKITSRIVRPQIWPQSELSLTHVSKEVAYDELSIEEFTAGYCAILKSKRLTEVERSARIDHLYDLMYLAMHYEWAAVRRFHAAVLLEIERSHLRWGDSFTYLERHSFHDQPKRNARQKPTPSSPANPVLFCRDYQREKCRHDNDHFGTIRGNKKWLQHICAKCWITSRTRERHPEFSSTCPYGDSAKASPTTTTPGN